MKKAFTKPLKSLFFVFITFSIWFIVSELKIINPYILPPPHKVWTAFTKVFINGELFEDIAISLLRVFKGFTIAFVLAFLLSMTSLIIPYLKDYYEFLIQFFRNVPPLSLIPLLILWCGIGETTKTVIIVLASFFPMYLNIMKGFSECDKGLLEVGDVFGYTKFQKFFKITLPYALSDILVGMRIGLGYSWRAIIGAEMIAASTGIGHFILFSQELSRTDKVIVGIIVIGLVGYACDYLFSVITKKLTQGKAENA